DVGEIDLVCHLGAPRALATLIQRVGRSGHARGAVPKGIVFPLTRDDLVQAAAAVRAVRAGELDRLVVPRRSVDLLAQPIPALGAAGADSAGAAPRPRVPRPSPPRARDTPAPKSPPEMGPEGGAPRRGRRAAHLHWDRVHGRVRPRRAARLVAITGGGAIPDT